jgi:hypothetical protein
MSPVVVVAVVVAAVAVVLLALLVVGRETASLASQPKQALFDVDEAVDFVAEALPHEVSARISYDDVRALVRFHLAHLAASGAPAERWNAGHQRLVIVDDEEGAEVLMRRAIESGLDLGPDDVAAVLGAELAYFEAIGAVGPAVPEPLELLAAEEAMGELGTGDHGAGESAEQVADQGADQGADQQERPAGPA